VARQRFLAIWLGFGLLYLTLAALGPDGLLDTGSWPQTNQHLLQVRAWRGEDIEPPAELGSGGRIIEVTPRLDVTPYFRDWVLDDPRERVLMTNIACGVRATAPDGRLQPIEYLPPDSLAGRLQMERLECHVGSPLGPAFLLMPLRMLLGSALATQWLGALLGGLAVALMDLLLLWWLTSVRGQDAIGGGERLMLLVLAGAGTLWLWLAPLPEVWFFAQTVATTCLVLSMVLAARGRWLTAGLAFALAACSRPPTALSLPLLLAFAFVGARAADQVRSVGRPHRMRALALASLFPVVVAGLHLILNQLRFGSPLEAGYRFMLTPPELRGALAEHGPLSLAFLARNARYLFIAPPSAVVDDGGAWTFPYLVSDPQGMGVVFSTPAFLAVLLALGGSWRGRGLIATCWLALVLVTVPSLLYFNTGWVQWGARYLLDAWPMWLMLAALGLGRVRTRMAWLLVGLSVASNLWAALVTTAGWWP
jgi:hypothetical protein